MGLVWGISLVYLMLGIFNANCLLSFYILCKLLLRRQLINYLLEISKPIF